MQPREPLLDACLIVKDEELNLPACLDSLRALGPLLGRVCVYDTGSSDTTVALARRAGALVKQGYWDGDFSRARNESLRMANAPWALIIDADEQVRADPGVLGKTLEAAAELDVLNADLSHVDDQGAVIGHSSYGAVLRIGSVRYSGRVHEVASRTDGRPTRTLDLPVDVLTFRHTGYATQEIRRAKAVRNAAVAERELREARSAGEKQRLAEALYHHARSVLRLDDTATAVAELQEAWTAFEPASVGRDRVAVQLVPALLAGGDHSIATSLLRCHLADGGSPELVRLLLAEVAGHTGRHVEALALLEAIPPEGAPGHEVTPVDVLTKRLQILDHLDHRDEALACCLLLVGRHGETGRVGELLHRVEGQDAGAVAQLLVQAAGSALDPAVVEALRNGGGIGPEVAIILGA